MITIDGAEYDFPCSIGRTAEIESSSISGMLLDKTYFNDVIATYLSYDVSLAIPSGMEDDYAALYETLSAPVPEHVFMLPYNQGSIEVTARVASISDTFYREEKGVNIWRGISFNIVSTRPDKEPE